MFDYGSWTNPTRRSTWMSTARPVRLSSRAFVSFGLPATYGSIACSSFSCVHSTHASAAVEALWHTACDKLGLAPESSECFYIYGCGNELELLLIGEEAIGDVMRNWIATEHKCVVSAVATLADRQLVDISPG